MKKLTVKQEALLKAITQQLRRETALAYISLGYENQTKAYLLACETMGREPSKNPEVSGSEILNYPNVVDFLDSVRIAVAEEVQKKHCVTVESLMAELEESRGIALGAETPQCGAANSATMGKAKLAGLDKQIVETTIKIIDDGSDDW